MFTTNGDGASNIKHQLAMTVQALNNMQYLWTSASKELKLRNVSIPNCYILVWNMGTAKIWYQKKKCIRDEMLPQNITYTLDSSSHQLFNIKWTSSTNELGV